MKPSPSTWQLPYEPDSKGLMCRLARLARPAFLDSGHQRESARRFDILSAQPVAWLQFTAGKFTSSDPGLSNNDEDIFILINKLKDKYLVKNDAGHAPDPALPFRGGLLGYLGYPHLTGSSTLRVQDAYVGVYRWAIVVDHTLRRTTVVLDPLCSGSLRTRLRKLLGEPAASSPQSIGAFRLTAPFQRNLTRSQYDAAFHAIKNYIRAGDCYQVNLTQQVAATCTGSPIAAYLRLRTAMPAPFSAYIGWPGGALLSVSPERFLRCQAMQDGTAVLSQPIKGTRPRHPDPLQDQALADQLQCSEKDKAENLMIVDLLRNDLGRVCETGSVKVNQLFALQSFSNVHHLVSTIQARLAQGKSSLDVLQACYPGGSITGAPKLRAMAIIQEQEAAPRRVYCGTAFYLSADGTMDSSITIRSLLWESGRLQCWAGGGIVDDSDADAEYAECFDKISNIISVLSD